MRLYPLKTIVFVLCLLLVFQMPVAATTPAKNTTAFSLEKLQSGVKSLKKDLKSNKLYESRLTAISNELIKLNNEFAKGIKVKDTQSLNVALEDIDKSIKSINLKDPKLTVYEKTTSKNSVKDISSVKKKIDKIKSSVAKAKKNYSGNGADSKKDNWAKIYYDYLSEYERTTYTSAMYGGTYVVSGHVVNGGKRGCMSIEFRKFDGYNYPVLVSWELPIDANGYSNSPMFYAVVYLIKNGKVVEAEDSSVFFTGEGPDEMKGTLVKSYSFKPENGGDPENIKHALEWLKTQM